MVREPGASGVRLEAGVGFAMPDLDDMTLGFRGVRLPEIRLEELHVDTPDLRLLRSGLGLRHLVGHGSPGADHWELELPPSQGRPRRLTWSVPGDDVPVEIEDLVRAYRRSEPLGGVARLVTHRRRTELRTPAGERLATLDDDLVSVLDGARLEARFRCVTLEPVGDAPDELFPPVLTRLETAGALRGDERSPIVRAIGWRARRAPDVVRAPIARDDTMADVARGAIVEAYLRLVAHDIGVRLDEDPEDVHQARVATRRLRSDLRTFADILDPAWADSTRGELSWLAGELGALRDADVLSLRLRREIERLDHDDRAPGRRLLDRLADERELARAALMAAMSSDRYSTLLDTLVDAVTQLPVARPPTASSTGTLAPPGSSRLTPPVATASGARSEPMISLDELATIEATGRAEPAERVGPTVAQLTVAQPTVAQPTPGDTGPDSGSRQRAALVGAVELDTAIDQVRVDPVAVDERPIPTVTSPAARSSDRDPDRGPGPVVEPPTAAAALAPSVTVEVAIPKLTPRAPLHADPERDEPLWNAPARKLSRGLLARRWRHLSEAVAELPEAPEDELLHDVRVRVKRLRYAAEAVEAVVGDRARRVARVAASLQDVLGEINDAVVAQAWLRRVGADGGNEEAMVAGQLVASERNRAASGRQEWREAWKAMSAKRLRSWFD
jgi:CHAD domain-containing protein